MRILGVPAPQGSKTALPGGRLIEGGSATGRARHRAWRTAVAEAAAEATTGRGGPFDGPVAVALWFRLPRPASRRRDLWADRKPDLDKLIRCTIDGLADGGLVINDARVVQILASKQLADVADPWTGAVVRVGPA